MTANEHYDNLLGEAYPWMLGDFREKLSEQKDFFVKHRIRPQGDGIAFDLGAGTGIQSVALAELGFKVKAADFKRKLLEELSINKNELRIDAFEQDITTFLSQSGNTPELIVCMGDTLTHLPDRAALKEFTNKMAAVLPTGGKLILSWRDLSEERYGTDRFIHVRSDDNRSMSCFLEYFPQHVMVHDLIVERINGTWTQKVSCYPKLRLTHAQLAHALEQNQIAILHEQVIRGMIFLIGQKI